MNSTFLGNYRIDFLNASNNLTTGNAKLFPIPIPTPAQLAEAEGIFERAAAVQRAKFAGELSEAEAEAALEPIQAACDAYARRLYGLEGP